MGFEKKEWKDRVSEYPNRRVLTKTDGSTEDVYVSRSEGTIAEEGDAFSAENMNGLEERIGNAFGALSAADGTDFRFGVNEKGEYGYIVTKDGADTVIPFSNARKLYEALEYSGLVTEDMSFDEMCATLAKAYPEYISMICGGWEYHAGSGAYASQSIVSDENSVVASMSASESWATVSYKSPTFDITNFDVLEYVGSASINGDEPTYYANLILHNLSDGSDIELFKKHTSGSQSFNETYDVSELSGNYCFIITIRDWNGDDNENPDGGHMTLTKLKLTP